MASSELDLRIVAARSRLVSGESLPVYSILLNTGPKDARIPNLNDPSPFSYLLANESSLTISYQKYAGRLTQRVSTPKAPLPPFALPAGGRTQRLDDLALWNGEPIAPGLYRLSAMLPGAGLPSNELPIHIEPPDYEFFASHFSTSGRFLIATAVHRELDDSLVLMQSESDRSMPGSGVFHRRRALPPGAGIWSLASSVTLHDQPGGYWMAWISDAGALAGLMAWASQIQFEPPSIALDLPHARLLSPGVVLDDGSGIFLALAAAGGALAARQYRMHPAAIQLDWETKLPLPADTLDQAQWYPSMESGTGARWHLVSVVNQGDSTGVSIVEFEGPDASVHSLTVPGTLLAAAMHPVFDRGSGCLNLVTGPLAIDVHRIRLADRSVESRRVTRWRSQADPDRAPEAWAVGPSIQDPIPVVAAAEGDLWLLWTGLDPWRKIAERAYGDSIGNLTVIEAAHEKNHCQWVDPASGARTAILPIWRS